VSEHDRREDRKNAQLVPAHARHPLHRRKIQEAIENLCGRRVNPTPRFGALDRAAANALGSPNDVR